MAQILLKRLVNSLNHLKALMKESFHSRETRRKPYLREIKEENDLNMPKNTRSGLQNNGRITHVVMNQNVKFSVQTEDSV